jgi:radical SAM protein with 4Fe4S-binding SPASM domain
MKTNFSIVPKVLRYHPELAWGLFTSFFSKVKSELIDYNFYNGKAKSLALMSFRITPLCNLQCVMCGQRGKTGVLKGKHAVEESKKIVSLDRYKELADELSPHNPVIYMWGGEPFLYPNFMDLAEYMVKRCPVFTVNTNGTHLQKNAERIVKDKWAGIFVSLDGHEEINDQIRGKGTYKRVIDGIKEINKYKKQYNSALPYVGIVSVVNNINYLYLEDFVDSVQGLNLSWHIINLGTYTNQGVINEHKKFMKETLDTDAKCIEGFANGYNEGIDGEKFAKILAKVQNKNVDYPIITVPVINSDKIGEYYAHPENLVRDRCICPWIYANIDYNGDVHYCADYPDYVVGNIKENKFFDIFNNERSIKFRHALKNTKNGIFPGCKRCYQLNLLGRRRKGY